MNKTVYEVKPVGLSMMEVECGYIDHVHDKTLFIDEDENGNEKVVMSCPDVNNVFIKEKGVGRIIKP